MEPERCAECGFDATLLTTADAVAALRSMGRRWRAAFKDVPEDRLRRRPHPEVWSPIEYAAHTRDVLALIGWAMNEVLDGSHPSFDPIDPDPPGTDHGYNELDPKTVLGELEANAERMAGRADRALPEHWKRTAAVGAEEREGGWFLRHAVHDASHHLRDVDRDLGSDR